MKFYKIKRLTDGKFLVGWGYPDFTDNGKSWVKLSDVIGRLSYYRTDGWYGAARGKVVREECVVREYIIDEDTQSLTIKDYNIKELMGWND